jgi:hypothetical protein
LRCIYERPPLVNPSCKLKFYLRPKFNQQQTNLCNWQGNEIDQVIQMSHILQEFPLTDPTIRHFCQDAIRTLSQLQSAAAKEQAQSEFRVSNYSEKKHKQQLLKIRDGLLKGLAGGLNQPESDDAFIAVLSSWLSEESQLRMMVDGAWTHDNNGLLRLIIHHVNHVSSNPNLEMSNPRTNLGLGSFLASKRLAKTRFGFLGFVPASTRIGDTVSYLSGSRVPLITRQISVLNEQRLDQRIVSRFAEYIRPVTRPQSNSPNSDFTPLDRYMVSGSVTSSKVKHVVVIGLSSFNEKPIWNGRGKELWDRILKVEGPHHGNGRKDRKWTDLYAMH